ncbi:MAG: hypothetical protein Q9169_000342 [Polycauliona sp. 2 TL-2023]
MANMEAQFHHIERTIESQPMPAEYQNTKSWIYCNDCNAKSSVKYHWIALKCGVCDSYNTVPIRRVRATNESNVLDGSATTSAAGQSQGRALDIGTQAQNRPNTAPPPAVISPARSIRPNQAQNLEEFAREALATDEYRVSMEDLSGSDYSDVDFWGLDEYAEHDISDEGDMKSCTAPGETCEPNDDDGDDDDGDDDDDDVDEMEIPGHR